jgi:hypothetical protein
VEHTKDCAIERDFERLRGAYDRESLLKQVLARTRLHQQCERSSFIQRLVMQTLVGITLGPHTPDKKDMAIIKLCRTRS